eukprot:gnl/MRDRNA2_/MRDRNA2_79158_c0_seq1.p1 gnl/MRDRNA2_/MRDRNA2_79158_c0~~gnl/MRDRNA2_/MRDRNA2_79158_c0_seq1.p1  ORF type:complete len:680 (+),score=81.74 gnl/MRDRNA2_/MRDRNA2_79158_c0_seq1:94-2133(+)
MPVTLDSNFQASASDRSDASVGSNPNPSGQKRRSMFQATTDKIGRQTLLTMEESKSALLESTKSRMKAYGRSNSFLKKEWFNNEKGMWGTFIFIMEGTYYWVYVTYIITIMLIGATLMWWMDPEHDLEFLDALYSAAACVTQSGLATVDWHVQATTTHVISFFLIIGGSGSLLTVVPACLKVYNFRKQWAYEKTLIPENEISRCQSLTLRDDSSAPLPPIRASSIISGVSEHWSDDGSESDDWDVLAHDDPDMMRSLEYMAFRWVIKIMLGYWAVSHLVGFIIFYVYLTMYSDWFAQYNIPTPWHAAYLVTSSFQNNGLLLTPDSAEPFAKCPVILITVGLLIAGGNTCLAIMSRVITYFVWYSQKKGTYAERSLRFLLDKPRHCYTHMFPHVHTLWLTLVFVVLLVLQVVVIWWQDWDNSGMVQFDDDPYMVWNKFCNALFQAFTTRTAGINSVDIYRFSMGTTFLMAVMMYISTSPTVVTMRLSSVHHHKQHAFDLDVTGRMEGLEDAIEGGEGADTTVKSQAQRYLTQHATYLVVVLFFICVFEREGFEESARRCVGSHYKNDYDGNGIYNDFDFFKILFEMASAYGTVGLSLGWRAQPYSFSGAWSRNSQLCLIFVMLLGRFRGLPDSVDPSVQPSVRAERASRAYSDIDPNMLVPNPRGSSLNSPNRVNSKEKK